MFNKEEYKSVINIPFAVIIASFIIIIVTTGMTDSNGLSALIGGYSGLLFGLIFIIIRGMWGSGPRIQEGVLKQVYQRMTIQTPTVLALQSSCLVRRGRRMSFIQKLVDQWWRNGEPMSLEM